MKEITVKDCEELQERFEEYCLRAKPEECKKLLMYNIKMNSTIMKIEKAGKVENQLDTRAMFRVILKVMGEDFSDYQEE